MRHARTKGPRSRNYVIVAAILLFSAAVLSIAALRPRDELAWFGESAWREAIACERLLSPIGGGAVADLTPIDDTRFAALYPQDRELIIYNRKRQPLHVVRFDEAGPRGIRNAASAAVTDTSVHIVDDASALIKRFDYKGKDLGTIRVPFLPRRIRVAANRLLVTPMVAGGTPAHLLFTLNGGGLEPVGAPVARYEDVGINTLANMASLVGFPDRAVLMHELAVPFGYVFSPNAKTYLTRFAVPLSVSIRNDIDRLPTPPLTERNVNDFTVVAFAAAGAVGTGKTYYVTRIGDGKRKPYRKLLVGLDRQLKLSAVYPIDVNPHHMVYVEKPAAILTVDAEDNWAECKLP